MLLRRVQLSRTPRRGPSRLPSALLASALVAGAFTASAGIVLADTPPLEVTAAEYLPATNELVIDYAGADAALPRVEVDGREVTVPDGQRTVAGATGTVVLAIEASSSTAGPLLEQELQYARAFVEGVRPGVAVGLVFFGDVIREEAPTTDRAVVLHALDNPPVGTAAALYDGVASAAEMLRAAPTPRTMAVLTFGWHFGSSGASRAQSIEAARASGAVIHTVAVGSDYDLPYLGELAGGTGSFQAGANPAQAGAIALGAGSVAYRLRVPIDLAGGQHTVRVSAGTATVERTVTSTASTSSPTSPATSSTSSSGATGATSGPGSASPSVPAEVAPEGTSSGGWSVITAMLVGLLAAGAAFLGWRKLAAAPALDGAFGTAEATEASATTPLEAAAPHEDRGSALEAPAEVLTPLPALDTLAELADELIAADAEDTAEPAPIEEPARLGPTSIPLEEAPAVAPEPVSEPTLASLIESFEHEPPAPVVEDDAADWSAPLDERPSEVTSPTLPQPAPVARAGEVLAEVTSALASARASLTTRLSELSGSGIARRGIGLRRSGSGSSLRPGLASTVEARVRHALQRHALAVLYQPVCDGTTGTVAGGEALLRTEGILEAGAARTVVREASALGRMPEITAFVVPEACRTAAALAAAGSTIPVSMNLSAEQLLDRDFMRVLTSSLLEHGVRAGQVAIEVPEYALIGNASAIGVLHDASRLGVLIVVDDFWASTSELMGQLPPLHAVKVDVSHGSGSARAEQELLRVVRAAHDAKVEVIAKRVETEADRAFAAVLGCELMQGNEFSRPVTAEEFVAMRDGVQVSPPTGGAVQDSPSTWDIDRRHVA